MRNLRSFLFALTALFMATAAHAQQTDVKGTVPFDFVVGNRTYPAGEYSVKSMGEGSVMLRVDNAQESKSGIVLSYSCIKNVPSDTTTLVFHRVGGSYFLYQVWTAGNSAGRELPLSRTEIQISQNRVKPELVIVAANISH
jgi:hypothetical protein